MMRATANVENRAVELEVADLLLQLQHKDDPSVAASTDQARAQGEADEAYHPGVAITPASSPLASGNTTAFFSVATSTTTRPTQAIAVEAEEQMKRRSPQRSASSAPRLGIDFLLNHPPSPSSAPPSSSSSSSAHSWLTHAYRYGEAVASAVRHPQTTIDGAADLPNQQRRLDYVIIEDEDDVEGYPYQHQEEGETATQTDRSSDEDDEGHHLSTSGSYSPLLEVSTSLNPARHHQPRPAEEASTTTTTTSRTLNSPPLHEDNCLQRNGGGLRDATVTRRCLNEKLRQRLEEKRRRSALQATTTVDPEHDAKGAVGQETASDAATRQGSRSSTSRRATGGGLSTPSGRRGVATRKELDIWEQLMLTSVIQPLLPSPSPAAAPASPTPSPPTSASLSSSPRVTPRSLSASAPAVPLHSPPSRHGCHQHQPEAPVSCMCAFGPASAYSYYSHGHGSREAPAEPHWAAAAQRFPDNGVGYWPYHANEERKRKRRQKSENEGDEAYFEDRHFARLHHPYAAPLVDPYHQQSHAAPYDYRSQEAEIELRGYRTRQQHYYGLPHEAKRRRSDQRDSSALVFHHMSVGGHA